MIYADIIRGKLDQQNQQLEVDYAIGRDLHPEAIGEIITVLQDWYVHQIYNSSTQASQPWRTLEKYSSH